jgi:transcriptional regulator with XRE-family HTH domain
MTSASESMARRWTAVIVGERIRELRRQRGISQKDLADRAGISPDTLSRLERQLRTSCRTRTIVRLAAALGEEPTSISPSIGQRGS